MFTNPFRNEDSDLNEAIAESFLDLKGCNSDDEEYGTSVDQIVKLYALKPKGLNPDTLLIVAGNIIIGVAVLNFERDNLVRTKLWNFIMKTK